MIMLYMFCDRSKFLLICHSLYSIKTNNTLNISNLQILIRITGVQMDNETDCKNNNKLLDFHLKANMPLPISDQ